MTRRKLARCLAAQIAVLIVVFGGWQLFTSLKIVDPFFFGQPSGIVSQARDWVQHGTSFGSIWLQICDHDGGSRPRVPDRGGRRHRGRRAARAGAVPVRGAQPLHQGGQRAAAHRARHALRHHPRARHLVEGRPRRLPGLLRGLLQRLPGRPRGGREPDQQRAGPRRVADAGGPQRGHPVRDDLDHRVAARGVRFRGHRRDRRGGPRRAARPRRAHHRLGRTTSTPTASSPA